MTAIAGGEEDAGRRAVDRGVVHLAAALLCALTPRVAAADDVCLDPVADPMATPLREGRIDAQRSACLRSELAAGIDAHALIDTPGFHGFLGGDLTLRGRYELGDAFEVGAIVRLVDFAFAQTAVNKATATRFGPLVLEAAWAPHREHHAQLAIAASVEVPATRDDIMDTTRSSGQLAAVFTGKLATRWTLHARFGATAAAASSAGGDTGWFGLRAGADVVRLVGGRSALLFGGELQAGWHAGFDTALARFGYARGFGGTWRAVVGLGLPAGGNDRTTAVLDVSIVRAR